MTNYLKNRFVRLGIAAATMVALVTAQWLASDAHNNQDMNKAAKMTEKMKSVCVGRFLIDLPDQAEYSYRGAFVNGFDLSVYPETEEEFKARLAKRETELRNPEPNYAGEIKRLETAKDINVANYVGKIFFFGRETTEGLEHNQRVEITSIHVEVLAHSNGYSVAISNASAYPDRPDLPLGLLSQIKLNPDNRIPTEPGFCIDHAYIQEPLPPDDAEQITLLAGIPEHPDLAIMFDMTPGASSTSEGLLARTKRLNDSETPERLARLKDLGAGPREINGIPGEQSLERYHEFNSTTGYSFAWESHGTTGDVFRPTLYFELQTGVNPRNGGKPVQSSLSEKAVLTLWDKITSSIRVRPTEGPKVSAADPPLPPLGTMASAGDICPQTGWWLCGEGGNGIGVLGGQRQYIKQGQRMPQALLLPPQTVLEKVRGLQRSYESATATTWKLVDKRASGRTPPTVPLAQPIPADPGDAIVTDEQAVAIGTLVTTGNPCPISGWWRCGEPNALDGTRWFAQGSLLPAVTLAMPTAMFSRWRGAARTFRRDGTWRLVRFAPAPAPEPEAGNRDSGQASS